MTLAMFFAGAALACLLSSYLGYRWNSQKTPDQLAALRRRSQAMGPGRTSDEWLRTVVLYPRAYLAVGCLFFACAVLIGLIFA